MIIKKRSVLAVIMCSFVYQAHADVLVILPESGPLARAGLSVKQGFTRSYQSSHNITRIKFVDETSASIPKLLKKNITRKTNFVVGPLTPDHVEQLIKTNPKIKVLALNQNSREHRNVLQFSLSKFEDAKALAGVISKDKIEQLYVYRDENSKNETEQFLLAYMGQSPTKVQIVDKLPRKLKKNEGVLFLGKYEWLMAIDKLPKKRIYIQPISIEENKPLPIGVKFCDLPALYEKPWKEKLQTYQMEPTSYAYKRLIAFGADAWQITEHSLDFSQSNRMIFNGMTGNILIENNQIQRAPHCYEQTRWALKVL